LYPGACEDKPVMANQFSVSLYYSSSFLFGTHVPFLSEDYRCCQCDLGIDAIKIAFWSIATKYA
jgi:hypothetical protein